jgi:cytidine deaminase
MSLKQAATDVRQNAHAPYSNFKVGAAVRTVDGTIYVGCNVENVAYPEGTCAEAGAIAAMVAAGERTLAEVFVIADSPSPGVPDVMVTLATTRGATMSTTIGDLLPGSFTAEHMAD